MTPAEKQRLYRERQAKGLRIYRVTVSERVLLALLERGMPELASRRRKQVSAALSEILELWAAEWVGDD